MLHIFVGCSMFLSNIVSIVKYCQVSWRLTKSILTIQFLTGISQYFTVLLSGHHYRVFNFIGSESICQKINMIPNLLCLVLSITILSIALLSNITHRRITQCTTILCITTLRIPTLSIVTLSIVTLSIMALSLKNRIVAPSIVTLSIMALSLKNRIVAPSITKLEADCYHSALIVGTPWDILGHQLKLHPICLLNSNNLIY